MSRLARQAFTVSAGLSVVLMLVGGVLFLLDGPASGFEFGGRKGLPNWDGGGKPQSIPWWGVVGLGAVSLGISFFIRAASRMDRREGVGRSRSGAGKR